MIDWKFFGSVDFNVNMKQVASGGADCTVMVWNFKPQVENINSAICWTVEGIFRIFKFKNFLADF